MCLHRTCAHRRTPGNPHLTSPTGHHDMAVGFLPGTRRTWTWRDHAPGMEGAIRSCAAGTLPDIQRPLLGPLQSQYVKPIFILHVSAFARTFLNIHMHIQRMYVISFTTLTLSSLSR